MSGGMDFTKMQGAGNDFIVLNNRELKLPVSAFPDLARRVCTRRVSLGANALMVADFPTQGGDLRMRFYNADGSEGEMCGNGVRCVGKFVYDKGLTDKTELTVETLAGVKRLSLELEDGGVSAVTVDMGAPVVGEPLSLTVGGRTYQAIPVSMGNPHIAVFLEDIASLDLPAIGPGFERHPAFPERTNTEFVRAAGPSRLEMRVWERGSGETLACGTGACAAVAAAAVTGRCGRHAEVRLLGGTLEIRWEESDGHIYMTGPAVTVFEGTI